MIRQLFKFAGLTALVLAFAGLTALVLAVATPAGAQTLTGSIAGVVKDEQGAVLPGATVVLTGARGNRSTTSETDGTYRFPALEPGHYSVSAELSGFRATRQENLVVNAGTTLTVDLALAVGGVAEEINVVAESPIVDVKSSATQTTISQDLLFSAPITRTAINVLNYAPGINSSSAYGGEASSSNALMIDGVDTRDPSGGTAWTFYNYNMVEEVQFQGLGAPAEYGAFTGAVVNTITKSGGNRYSGLFELFGTGSSLASSNIDDEIIAQNPSLADPAKTTKYLDLTTQLGGPLKRDQLFFFLSAQRFRLDVDPAGAVTKRKETSPRVNGKLTWQPSSSDNYVAHVQFDSYQIHGRNDVGLSASDETTNDEDAPEWYWLGQWRHVFGPSTFSEVKYAGWWGFYDLNPVVNAAGHRDVIGLASVSQGWFYWADRGRHQANAALSHYANAFGAHEFKFGAEIERSYARDRYGYIGGYIFYDYEGAPYTAYSYGYDVKGINTRTAFFAQDAWKIHDRVTLNLGLRGDLIRGSHEDVGNVYSSNNWSPRLGAAWDVLGDYRTVLKTSYGWYYEGAQVNLYQRALPGYEDFVLYDVLGPGFTNLVPYSITEAFQYKIDDDIKHPRVDEFTLGFERALRGDMRLTVTGIWRDNKNFVNSVNPNARWRPVQRPERLNGQTITLYQWANAATTEQDFVITNIKGFQYIDVNGNVIGTADPYRKYRGLMLVLNKRFTNRWQAQASYVLSKAEGTVNNTSGQQLSSRQFETPNLALLNVDGELTNSRRHEFKLIGSYQIPVVEVALNAYLNIMSGRPYEVFERFGTSATTGIGTVPATSWRQPLLEQRGSRRNDTFSTLDLRIEKVFSLAARDRIGVFMEIENTLNNNTITGRFMRAPSTTIVITPGVTGPVLYDAPSAVQAPRQVRLGARWSF